MALVLVVWADAHEGPETWTRLVDVPDDGDYLVTSCGHLIAHDQPGGKRNHLTLIQSVAGDCGDGFLHIPVEMVRCTRVLG